MASKKSSKNSKNINSIVDIVKEKFNLQNEMACTRNWLAIANDGNGHMLNIENLLDFAKSKDNKTFFKALQDIGGIATHIDSTTGKVSDYTPMCGYVVD